MCRRVEQHTFLDLLVSRLFSGAEFYPSNALGPQLSPHIYHTKFLGHRDSRCSLFASTDPVKITGVHHYLEPLVVML
jgi:hypothetical protein